ncbi:MAG: VTT domain-containing protein [Candidatus Sumerlaeia bacterium]|nr:VTT domain-containing protein [Candidatus Sumerlaeia bacterium]
MTDTASAVLANVAESPVQQALLAAFFTLFMEDPTVIVCGLLIADGQMSFFAALIGLALGIHVGDLTLYLVGRFFGDKIMEKGWLSQERYDRWAAHLDRNLFMAVVISRFVPGTRIPAFMGAGILKAPFHRFLLIGITASFMWTLFLLLLVIQIGEQVLPLLGQYKYPAIAALLLGLLVIPRVRRAWRKRSNKPDTRPAPEERVASGFAFWHPVIFYTPVAFYYLYLSIKYRSLSLPSAANPSIYSGGVIRDSKNEIMALVPSGLHDLFPKTRLFRKKAGEPPREEMRRVAQLMKEAGMDFPLVAKPDIGHRGDGVRLLRNRRALAHYLHRFPPGEPVILQELAERPNEAGVLYYRFPGEQRGHLLSLTLKDFPVVVGDGRRTLEELILSDSRARLISEVYFVRHKDRLKRVIPKGRRFRLAFCGVHCQGAIFRNATPSITSELSKRIHEIASQLPHFYFGRFDVRYRDLSSFLRGEDFEIIEINGASSESTHIWDRDISLREAYSVLFRQFDILFRIGDLNRRAGHRPIGAMRLLGDFIRYRRQAASYPTAS